MSVTDIQNKVVFILLEIGKKVFIVVAIIWIVLQTLFFFFPNDVVLNTIGHIFGYNLVSSASNPAVIDETNRGLYSQIFDIFYLIALFTSIMGALFLGRGRKLYEVLGLFFGFGIPRRRKSWGTIINGKTKEPIPFTTVNIIQKDEQGNFVKIVSQDISDVDGKYRIPFNASLENLYLNIRATNFQTYEKEITKNTVETTQVNDIAEDIELLPLNEEKVEDDSFRNKFNNRVNLPVYNFAMLYLLTFSFLAFMFGIYSVIVYPSMISYEYLIIFGSGFAWNVFVIWERSLNKVKKIIDSKTMKPVPFVSLKVFDNRKQLMALLTDESGTVNLALKAGKYLADVSKSGYREIRNYPIKINREGYISNNIKLEKLANNTNSIADDFKIDNPFN